MNLKKRKKENTYFIDNVYDYGRDIYFFGSNYKIYQISVTIFHKKRYIKYITR